MLKSFKCCHMGFTLFELLTAVALCILLAGICLPAYQDSLRQARRGTAKGELLRLADMEERWRMTHARYADLSELGGSSDNPHYLFSIPLFNEKQFTINAKPTNQNHQDLDACKTLEITQLHELTSLATDHCPRP